MKNLFILGIIFFSFTNRRINQVSVINIVNDTTVTGTWDLGGAIMRISAKISGECTITNALIEANPFIQIFDTAVSIGANVQTTSFSAMWYGAKSAALDNSTYLQKSIDACNNRPYPLFIPSGNYKYSKPLMVSLLLPGYTDRFQQSSIKMYGSLNNFWGGGTTLTYSGDSCALGFQLNKGTVVSNLKVVGGYIAPSPADTIYYKLTSATYTNQGSSGNGVGLWVDPVGNWNQRSGSTGCTFNDLYVSGFETLIKVSNNITQNGEIIIFRDIQLGQGKIGFQSSQPQEKNNQILGVYSWSRLLYLFDIGNSGAGSGNYVIDRGNIAGKLINLCNIVQGSYFSNSISNLYCESLGSIGKVYTSNMPFPINNCTFDFAYRSEAGTLKLLSSNSNNVVFTSCSFRYYGQNDALFLNGGSGGASFVHCTYSSSTVCQGCVFENFVNDSIKIAGSPYKYYRDTTYLHDTVTNQSIKVSIKKFNPNK